MMSLLLVLLIGCVSLHHRVEAGWMAGPIGGEVQHGGIATYTLSLTVDDAPYAIGGGGQVWGAGGAGAAAATAGADGWTDTLVDLPVGLRGQAQLLVPPDSPFFLPMGVAVRGGPYVSALDDDLRLTLTGHGQASLLGTPLVNWGAMAGVRWPVGALWPD